MKINIEDIPETGLSIEVSEEGEVLTGLAGQLDFSIPAPVTGHLELTRSEGGVYVSGELHAEIKLVCGRCLKEFTRSLDVPVSIFYTCYAEAEREKELTTSEMDLSYLPGGELDTAEVLLSQVSLEAPMKPLCKETCKGLCQSCGADLNEGQCGCKKEEKVDSRFAALKDFKVE
jgi:uncharacterized protein